MCVACCPICFILNVRFNFYSCFHPYILTVIDGLFDLGFDENERSCAYGFHFPGDSLLLKKEWSVHGPPQNPCKIHQPSYPSSSTSLIFHTHFLHQSHPLQQFVSPPHPCKLVLIPMHMATSISFHLHTHRIHTHFFSHPPCSSNSTMPPHKQDQKRFPLANNHRPTPPTPSSHPHSHSHLSRSLIFFLPCLRRALNLEMRVRLIC